MKTISYKDKVYHKVLNTEDLFGVKVHGAKEKELDLQSIFNVSSYDKAVQCATEFYNDFMLALINQCIDERDIVTIFGTSEFSKKLNLWNMFVDNRSNYVKDFNFDMGGYNPCLVFNMRLGEVIAARASHKYYLMKINVKLMKKIRDNVRKNKLYHSIIVNEDV